MMLRISKNKLSSLKEESKVEEVEEETDNEDEAEPKQK
jgi:hypothetical protein